jgi:hypothetical protein
MNIFLKIVSRKYVLDDEKKEDELSEDEYNKTNFKCNNCNRNFSSKRNYEVHIHKKTCMKGKYDCKYCNRKFTTHNSMYRHMKHTCKIKKQIIIENKQQDNKTKPVKYGE